MVKSNDTKSFKNQRNQKKDKEGIKFVRNNNKKIRVVVSDDTKKMRKLYNKLMQKDNKSKTDIVKSIITQIDGKYSEICFKHDGCRVLQGSIKYGSNEQRKEIISKLIPLLYNCINGKYSIYLSAKIFKYADTKQKEKILNEIIFPNFNKLLKFSGGISFIKIVFINTHSQFQDKLINHYIQHYLKISIEELKTLHANEINAENEAKAKAKANDKSENVIVEQDAEMDNESLREKIKNHLEKQLEMGIHKNYIFQGMLNKIFDLLDYKTQQYISELFDDDFLPFIDNTHGFELACKLYAIASAKTRKKIIKAFRENIDNYINTDNGIFFLIKVLLFTDDTKIIEKNFTKYLMEKLTEIFNNEKNWLKVIWNLLYPFNKKCNKPAQEAVLSYSNEGSNKKELSKRQAEVLSPLLPEIVKVVNYDVKPLMKDLLFSMFLIDILTYLIEHEDIVNVEILVNNIIATIEADFKANNEKLTDCLLTEHVGQVAIKRIMKLLSESKGEAKKYERSFAEKIAKMLKTNLEGFLGTKAIFLIVQIVENEKTKELLMKDLKKYSGEIHSKAKNEKMIGYNLLAKLV